MWLTIKFTSTCAYIYATPWTVARQAPLTMVILQARILEWVAMPSPPGDLPNPEIQPRSPTLKVDSLPSEPHQGSPWILEWVAYPFSMGSSWQRNWTGVSCIAGQLFIPLSYREAHTWLVLVFYCTVLVRVVVTRASSEIILLWF